MSVVAVSGAGGTLGPVVVERLRAAGHEVDAPGRDEVDLLDPAAAAAWAARLGSVGALVHLVGGWRGGSLIDETPDEDYDWLHAQLVGTVRIATRASCPRCARPAGASCSCRPSSPSSRMPRTPPMPRRRRRPRRGRSRSPRDLAEHGGTANILVVNAIGDDRPSFTTPAALAEAIAFLLSEHGASTNGQRIALHG